VHRHRGAQLSDQHRAAEVADFEAGPSDDEEDEELSSGSGGSGSESEPEAGSESEQEEDEDYGSGERTVLACLAFRGAVGNRRQNGQQWCRSRSWRAVARALGRAESVERGEG